MLFEIVTTTAMGTLAIYSKLKGGKGAAAGLNDGQKLQRIFSNAGLNIKEDGQIITAQLIKNRKQPWGRELVFRIPLGRSFEDYQAKIKAIEDGLNNRKRTTHFNFEALKQKDFKNLIEKRQGKNRDIEMEYDGMLKIKIYNDPMPAKFLYNEAPTETGWKLPIGKGRGNVMQHDFDKVYNMLVGGAVGGGKSAFCDMLITHFMRVKPEHVKFTLIDLKGGIEFERFRSCKQVVGYAEDIEQVEAALIKVAEEMKAIVSRLKAMKARNVIDAGIQERHFIVIDEIGEMASAKEVNPEIKKVKVRCEYLLSNIARLGRSQGMRVVVATQHPTAEILPIQVKRNCDARVSFKVDTVSASMVILDASGADMLPLIAGRAIYKVGAERTQLQTPWINEEQMDQVIIENEEEGGAEVEQPAGIDIDLFEKTEFLD